MSQFLSNGKWLSIQIRVGYGESSMSNGHFVTTHNSWAMISE